MVKFEPFTNFADPIKLFVEDMLWHPSYNSRCSSVCFFNAFSSSLDISWRWWCHKLYEIHKSTPFSCHHSDGCMMHAMNHNDLHFGKRYFHFRNDYTLEKFFKMTLAKVSNSVRTFPLMSWGSISMWWMFWLLRWIFTLPYIPILYARKVLANWLKI